MADSGTPRCVLAVPVSTSLFAGTRSSDEKGDETDEQMILEPMEVAVLHSAEPCEEQQQTVCDDAFQLEQVCILLEKQFRGLAFVMGFSGNEKCPMLTVTQRELHHHPPFGYTSRIQLVFKGNDCC